MRRIAINLRINISLGLTAIRLPREVSPNKEN